MLLLRAGLSLLLSGALVVVPAVASRVQHKTSTANHAPTNGYLKPTSGRHTRHTASSHRVSARATTSPRRSHILHGQQAIEPSRVTEIQQALIREHYMDGEANGQWDATTQAAMQKYQSDQGWQTKLMPDSRALKKLGLGADYSTAINAGTASFADPPPVSSIPASQAMGFAAAAGTNR